MSSLIQAANKIYGPRLFWFRSFQLWVSPTSEVDSSYPSVLLSSFVWSQLWTPIRQHTPTSNILCVLLLLVKVFVFFFHPLPSVGSTRKPNHYRSVAAERLRARVSNTLRSEIEGGVFESSTHRTRRPHNACAKFSFTSWKLFLGFCPASAKKITKKSPNFLQGPVFRIWKPLDPPAACPWRYNSY